MKLLLLLALPLAGLSLLAAGIAGRGQPAQAAGPCGTAHDGLDAQEVTFLGLVEQWRAVNVPFATDLSPSGSLSAAAAWFAEDLVEKNLFTDHTDSLGRNWAQRGVDCGYDPFFANGSGEGKHASSVPSGTISISPEAAIAAIGGQGVGSGIYIRTTSTEWPVKCVGIGHYRNAAATKEAWVVVLAQFPATEACPGSTAEPGPTPTSTPFPKPGTATPSPTPTRTPTPSPTPTPQPRFNAVLALTPGDWSLVTLPVGRIDDVLARAYGCYEVVYAFQEGVWLRYAPDIPAYAQNLGQTNGGAYWIKATGKPCGLIML